MEKTLFMKQDEYMSLDQEMRNLICELTSPLSDIGDWKVAKYQEYVLSGEESPYSIIDLHSKRQAARDRINEIKQILENAVVEQEEN